MSALQQARLCDPNSTLTRDEKLAEIEFKMAASDVPEELAEQILDRLKQLSELEFAHAWNWIGFGLADFWQSIRCELDTKSSRVLSVGDDPLMRYEGPYLEDSVWCISTK